jgi:hypothetical protein
MAWVGVAQPRKMVEYEHWQKKTSQNVDRRAVGCNLVVLKRAPPQSTLQSSNTLFSAARRATQVA